MRHALAIATLALMAGACGSVPRDRISSTARGGPEQSAWPFEVDQERRLPLEGAVNFRDLGGYLTTDGRKVRRGVQFRADALDSLTAADMEILSRLNVTRVTDLRSDAEVSARPDRLPPALMHGYVHLPLIDALARSSPARLEANNVFNRALAADDHDAIARVLVDFYYPALVRDGRAGYGRWMRGLLDNPAGAAQIFHCTGGADRTGVAAALLLLTLGVPREQVIKDYLLTNEFDFSPQATELFRSKGVPMAFRLQASFLEAAFGAMEADYGSIDNYIRYGLGIDDDSRQALRARYLE